MPFNADVLKSTLQDLQPGFIDNFTNWHPFTRYIKDSGGFQKTKLKGPWVEFNVLTGGPGRTDASYSGSEQLNGPLNTMLAKGKEYPHRFIYHFPIPNKMIEELETENDYANLIEALPEQALGDQLEGINQQIVSGAFSAGTNTDSNGTRGLMTFNGSQSYYPQDGSSGRTGVFQFAAPTSQTGTVHDLPLAYAGTNPTRGWYNQYGVISSFSSDGRSTLEIVRDRANRQGSKSQSGIDLILSDPGTRQNYINSLDAQVRTAMVDKKGEKVPDAIREAIKFGNADWFSDDHIDITDTTAFSNTDAQNGVAYMLNTSHWEMFTLGKNILDFKDLIPDPRADQMLARMVSYFNFFCKSLRSQGLVTGGNR